MRLEPDLFVAETIVTRELCDVWRFIWNQPNESRTAVKIIAIDSTRTIHVIIEHVLLTVVFSSHRWR